MCVHVCVSVCVGVYVAVCECRSQGGRKPIASCQREISSRHFLRKLFEKNFSYRNLFLNSVIFKSILEVVSVYTMTSQGIGGVVGQGGGLFPTLARFLPPSSQMKMTFF